jgi:phage terminase large subunit-like protein
MATSDRAQRWRTDPIGFITEALVNPQTGRPFELFEAERTFLQLAFTPGPDGDLPYREILWSGIKKSGKSTFGALCMLYTVICLGGRHAEAYVIANDKDQATDRIFTAAARIVEASPLLRADITTDRITFSNGSYILALASDYRGGAGVEPCFIVADEIWGFSSESAERLFDEVCPTPTRRPSVRMVTSYAGFTGESTLLENMVKRGLAGELVAKDLYVQPGMIAFVSHSRIAPWQTEAWFEGARRSTRPSAFMRQYLNQFTSGETGFVDMTDWDRCVDEGLSPLLSDRRLQIWVGLDGSYRHDATAIVSVTFDTKAQKVRLVTHRTFVPTKDEPVDFADVEEYLIELRSRFALRRVWFDPYQWIGSSQRMTARGLPMEAYAQTPSNLEAASTHLADLIRHHNIVAYPDAEMRLALSHTVAVETPRGMRISKLKASHRIDLIAALSFAVLGASKEGAVQQKYEWIPAIPMPKLLHGSPISGMPSNSISDRNSPFAQGWAVAAREDAEERFARTRARFTRNRHGRWSGF